MSQQITKSNPGATVDPVALARSRPDFLAWCRNGLTIYEGEATIFSDRAPTAKDRETLEVRSASLKAALTPGDSSAWAPAVATMLAGMPSAASDQDGMRLRGEAYRYALGDLPGWAIERMAKATIRGDAEFGKRFAPTPAEFREMVDRVVSPLRDEFELISQILNAKTIEPPKKHERGERPEHGPLTPQERARIIKGMKELRESLNPKITPEADKALAEARLNQAQAEGWGDVKLSSAARARLATPDQRNAG